MDFNARLALAEIALKKSESAIQQQAKAPSRTSKKDMSKILNNIQQVTSVLESLAELHPIAKTVVGMFKAILKLETDRRETSEQIVSVYHFMGTMMYSLGFLDTSLSNAEEPEQLRNRIKDEMTEMANCIEEFGEFANVYYEWQKRKLVRFFRAAESKEKLEGFIKTFNNHRAQIEFLLNVRQASIQPQILQAVQTIVARLGSTNEPQAEAIVRKCQGVHNVIMDEASIRKVAQALKDTEPLTSSTLSAIRSSLDDLLATNRSSFELKLRGAEMDIQEAIERSSQRILQRLDEGPHDLIKDLDVKEVWKANGWKLSVKCRHFVDALCSHFSIKFARLSEDSGGVRPSDEWTLQVLSKVNNHAAIGEAVDEDASGFLSVYEVNRFLNKKPKDWTTPEWFTYWAIGWQLMNFVHTISVLSLLNEIRERCTEIKKTINNEDLRGAMNDYLETITLMQNIVGWLDSLNDGTSSLEDIELQGDASSALDNLVEKFSSSEEKTMFDNLTKIDFAIPDPALLPSITGNANVRIEQIIMSLLNLVLKHQRDVICDTDHSLADADFASAWQSMDESLFMFAFTFHSRMKALLRSWRSLKLDLQIEVHCFAGGLFTGWYDEYKRPGSEIRRLVEADEDDDENEKATSNDLAPDQVIRDIHIRVDQLDSQMKSIDSMLRQLLISSGQSPPPPAAPHTTHDQSNEEPAPTTDSMEYGAHAAPTNDDLDISPPSPQREDQDVENREDSSAADFNDGDGGDATTYDQNNEEPAPTTDSMESGAHAAPTDDDLDISPPSPQREDQDVENQEDSGAADFNDGDGGDEGEY